MVGPPSLCRHALRRGARWSTLLSAAPSHGVGGHHVEGLIEGDGAQDVSGGGALRRICLDRRHSGLRFWSIATDAGKPACLPEQTLCEQRLVERFATHLVRVATVQSGPVEERGKLLDGSTAEQYLGNFLTQLAQKFRANGTPETKQFFNCQVAGESEESRWLRGLKTNMRREDCERKDASGAVIDKSEGEAARVNP